LIDGSSSHSQLVSALTTQKIRFVIRLFIKGSRSILASNSHQNDSKIFNDSRLNVTIRE
jgi:hypothetical protein